MARLLLVSDLHIRQNAPVGRIDDFQARVWKKLEFMFEIAEDNNVDAILQAGDFFDRPNPSISTISKFISMHHWHSSIPFFVVRGQHDLYLRSKSLEKTAIGLLVVADNFFTFDVERQELLPFVFGDDTVGIYGINYGDNHLDKLEVDSTDFSILVIHADIGDKPLYPGHEITDAGKFLRDHPQFNIILCGDYHYPFFIKAKNKRAILNTGCMLRLTRDERDMNRIPHFYIVDTEAFEFVRYDFPIEPSDQVFSMKKERDSVDNTTLMSMIHKLRQKDKVGIKFMDVLERYFKQNKVNKSVECLIEEVLSE